MGAVFKPYIVRISGIPRHEEHRGPVPQPKRHQSGVPHPAGPVAPLHSQTQKTPPDLRVHTGKRDPGRNNRHYRVEAHATVLLVKAWI